MELGHSPLSDLLGTRSGLSVVFHATRSFNGMRITRSNNGLFSHIVMAASQATYVHTLSSYEICAEIGEALATVLPSKVHKLGQASNKTVPCWVEGANCQRRHQVREPMICNTEASHKR